MAVSDCRCSSATAKVKLTVSVIKFLFLSPFVADYSRVVWTIYALDGAMQIFLYRFCFSNEWQNVFIIAVHYNVFVCSVVFLKYWFNSWTFPAPFLFYLFKPWDDLPLSHWATESMCVCVCVWGGGGGVCVHISVIKFMPFKIFYLVCLNKCKGKRISVRLSKMKQFIWHARKSFLCLVSFFFSKN